MYIVKYILEITNMSINELAEFISVRQSDIEEYLNGEEIPKKIKNRFATIFYFPEFYFDINIEENAFFRKIVIDTIKSGWEENKPKKYEVVITEDMIKDSLLNGYDLITHKKFDDDHILNNSYVKKYLNKILNNKSVINERKIKCKKENENIHDKLIEWRKKKSTYENLKENMIISDKVLNNIINTTITSKKDLLKVSGIGLATYGKYGDELYEIVKDKDKKEIEILD